MLLLQYISLNTLSSVSHLSDKAEYFHFPGKRSPQVKFTFRCKIRVVDEKAVQGSDGSIMVCAVLIRKQHWPQSFSNSVTYVWVDCFLMKSGAILHLLNSRHWLTIIPQYAYRTTGHMHLLTKSYTLPSHVLFNNITNQSQINMQLGIKQDLFTEKKTQVFNIVKGKSLRNKNDQEGNCHAGP